jgi:hypothetical protein
VTVSPGCCAASDTGARRRVSTVSVFISDLRGGS